MTQSKTNKPVTARAKARNAVAALKAERVARDKRIEDQAVAWYQLTEKVVALQQQLEAAVAEQVAVVAALDEDNVSVADIGTMLELSDADVRALRKQHRDTPRPVSDGSEPTGQAERSTVEKVGAGDLGQELAS